LGREEGYMSSIENLIGRLDKVKGRNGSWVACCPSHKDKSPSLAIRALEDGRILLHCFAGCNVNDVITSVGLTMDDLFPPKPKYDHEPKKPTKPRFYATDLLKIIDFEALVVLIAANTMSEGKALSPVDKDRMRLAYERIEEAVRCISD
jgi:hypothetical protein